MKVQRFGTQFLGLCLPIVLMMSVGCTPKEDSKKAGSPQQNSKANPTDKNKEDKNREDKNKEDKKKTQAPGEPHCSNQKELRKGKGLGPVEKPYFYQIKYKNQISHLLGTVHIGIALSDLPKEVMGALQSSQQIVGERAFDEKEVQGMQSLRKGGFWSIFDGTDLSNREENKLSLEERNRLVCHGVPSRLAKVLTDSACQMVLKGPYFNVSMDMEVLAHAYSKKLKITQLDSDQLLKESDQLEKRTQSDSCQLKAILKYAPTEVDALWAPTFEKYRAGDKNSFIDESDKALAYRNENWMPILETTLAEGNAFITMGAAHLYGTKGIITMLLAKGYEVNRWTPDKKVPNPVGSLEDSIPSRIQSRSQTFVSQMDSGVDSDASSSTAENEAGIIWNLVD